MSREETHRRKWRGKHAELKLCKFLEKHGFKAKRSAMSGIGRGMPDVFATKGDLLVAFEVKAARTKNAKIQHSQIAKLRDFLAFFDYYPKRLGVIAVTFPYKGWIFHKLEGQDWNRNTIKITPNTQSNWSPQEEQKSL